MTPWKLTKISDTRYQVYLRGGHALLGNVRKDPLRGWLAFGHLGASLGGFRTRAAAAQRVYDTEEPTLIH